MAKRGPAPKTKEKVNLPAGIPEPPDWLNDLAKREYMRVASTLHKAGLISDVDRAHLTAYSQAWAEYVELCQQIEKEGYIIPSNKGNPMYNPICNARDSAHRRMTGSMQKMGMSPSDRDRIGVKGKEDKEDTDPLAAFANEA